MVHYISEHLKFPSVIYTHKKSSPFLAAFGVLIAPVAALPSAQNNPTLNTSPAVSQHVSNGSADAYPFPLLIKPCFIIKT